jgi:enterochelin esterase-like enzyme
VNDLEMVALITRLSRPHASGGTVIERAAILAAGADYPEILDWIIAHSGAPETTTPERRSRGLHGARINDGEDPAARPPLRFVLPADALR